MRPLLFCLLPLLLLPAPAAAQPASPASTSAATILADLLSPPDVANARIERQISEMRSGEPFRQSLARDPQLRTELARNSPAVNAAIARIGELQATTMAPILRAMQADARRQQIARLAHDFTAAELAEITAFYRTAAGQKLLATQAEIARDVARSNIEKFAPRIQAAEKAMAPRIQAELKQIRPDPRPPAPRN